MKLFLLLLAGGQLVGAADLPGISLRGLARLPEEEVALIELDNNRSEPKRFILTVGNSDGDLALFQINAEDGSIEVGRRIRQDGSNLPSADTSPRLTPDGKWLLSTVRFEEPTNRLAKGETGLIFQKADSRDVLRLYAVYCNRTLLQSALLPQFKLTLNAVARDHQEAAVLIEKALSKQGIRSIPDGEKFLALVRTRDADKFEPKSSTLTNIAKLPSDPSSPTKDAAGNEIIPPGMVNFQSVEPRDVATIYSELVGRKFDHSSPLPPSPSITLKTQTPLSKDELLYALDTILAWGGVKMEKAGDHSTRLVRLNE